MIIPAGPPRTLKGPIPSPSGSRPKLRLCWNSRSRACVVSCSRAYSTAACTPSAFIPTCSGVRVSHASPRAGKYCADRATGTATIAETARTPARSAPGCARIMPSTCMRTSRFGSTAGGIVTTDTVPVHGPGVWTKGPRGTSGRSVPTVARSGAAPRAARRTPCAGRRAPRRRSLRQARDRSPAAIRR